MCKSNRREKRRVSRLAFVSSRLPFTHMFKTAIKMVKREIRLTFLDLAPPLCDLERDRPSNNKHSLPGPYYQKTGCLLCAVIDPPGSVSGKVWRRMLKKTHLFSLGGPRSLPTCMHAGMHAGMQASSHFPRRPRTCTALFCLINTVFWREDQKETRHVKMEDESTLFVCWNVVVTPYKKRGGGYSY